VYVCVCKAITQKQLEDAVASRKGQSAKTIMKALGVGSECGTCLEEAIQQMLQVSKKNSTSQNNQNISSHSRE
jgi:bacterioferritin-associated ferredoxin